MPTAPAASPAFLMAAGSAEAPAQQANGVATSASPFASLLVSLTANGQAGQGTKGNQPGLPFMTAGSALPGDQPMSEQEAPTGDEALLAASQLIAPAMPLENLVNLVSSAGDSAPATSIETVPGGSGTTTPAFAPVIPDGEVLAPATSAAESHATAPVSPVADEAFAGSADAILPALPEMQKDERPAAAKVDISAMEPVEPKVVDLASRLAKTETAAPVAELDTTAIAATNTSRATEAPKVSTTSAQPEMVESVLMRAFALPGGEAEVLPIYTAPPQPQSLPQTPANLPPFPADPPLPSQPPVETVNTTAPTTPTPSSPPTSSPPLEPPGLKSATSANGVVRFDGNAQTEMTQPAAPAPSTIPAGEPAAVTRPVVASEANAPVAASAIAQATNATRATPAAAKSGVPVERANGIERPVDLDEQGDEAIDGATVDVSTDSIPAAALAEAVVPATSAVPARLNREGQQPAAIEATGDVRGVSLNTPAQPARTDATQAPVPADAPASSQSAQLTEPTRQVASAVLEQVEAGGGDARLHLQPRELGDVVIHVRTRGDHVEVTVQAERAEAVAMLRDSANELTGLLGERGLNLADLNVGLGMQQQNRGQQWEPTALPQNSRRSNGEFAQLLGNEQPSAAPTHRRLQAAYNPDGRHIYRI